MVNRDVTRATLLVVFSACCFGSLGPLTIVALDDGMALQANQAWRYGTTALLLVGYGWFRRNRAVPHSVSAMYDANRAPWYSPRMFLLAGGGQALIATLALSALRWIPAATEAFLFYTFPAWVAVITAVRGIERIDRVRGTALVLAMSGVGIMVGTPSAASLHPVGVALALAAALVYALYIPMLDTMQRGRPPLEVSQAIATGGALAFLVWSLSTGTLLEPTSMRAVGSGVLQGVLSTGAFLGFLAGLAQLGPVRTAITSTIEPFWTALLGVLMLGQPIGPATYLGGVAIMGAVYLLQRPAVTYVVVTDATQGVASGGLHSSTEHEDGRSGRPLS